MNLKSYLSRIILSFYIRLLNYFLKYLSLLFIESTILLLLYNSIREVEKKFISLL